MNLTDIKNHPMFGMLSMTLGEEAAIKQLQIAITELAKKNQAETVFSKEEKKIIVPITMNKKQASEELLRQWKDEETVTDVVKQFEGWNWKDVLVAVKKAAIKHFGWVAGKSTQGFFGSKPPMEIDIVVDIKDGKKITETCFYGNIEIAAWENATLSVDPHALRATVKKRYSTQVREFYAIVQEILDTESIYRGKAIVASQSINPWGDISLDFEIFEMKISDKIFLNEDAENIVKNFIVDDLGEQGKRCYLFSGSYGNGKTETAMRVGAEGLKKGLAYFYCKDSKAFPLLLKEAVNYVPAICFMEDIDEIAAGTTRDTAMNQILNILDGVQTKGNDLTVIFTTNHENKINPALRRPGRIDMVINFENPADDTKAKIFESYLKIISDNFTDFEKVAKRAPDAPGAVIAEMAKRAVKLCSKRGEVTEELVNAAIDSMKHHLKLMTDAVEEKGTGTIHIIAEGSVLTGSAAKDVVKAKLTEKLAN